MAIRVLICDDDALARGAVESILVSDPDFAVVASATAADAIDHAMTARPQLALIASAFGDSHGLDLVRWFGTNLPGCRCVVHGPHLIDEEVLDCHEFGAFSLMTRGKTVTELLDAFRQIAGGYVADDDLVVAARSRVERHNERPFPDLDYTDRRILELIAEGHPNSAIAAILHYSRHTVRNRVSRLLRITGVQNRTQLAILAQQRFGVGI